MQAESTLDRVWYGGREVQNKSQLWKQKKQVRKHNDNSENKITIQKTQQQIW